MRRLDYWNARAAEAGYDPRCFAEIEGQWLPVISGGGPSGGGKTTVTSTTIIPGPTAKETELQAKQIDLLDLQVKEAQRQSKLLEESFPASQALLKEQLAATQELVAFQRKSLTALDQQAPEGPTQIEKEIKTLSDQRALAILKGEAPPLSPQQEGFIEETFKSADTEARTGLRSFAEELAATRGLKLTDTPIGDTVLRESARLSGGLAGAKATAKLDVSQTRQAFEEGVRQFQENLRQQAFLNRLALTGRDVSGLSAGSILANAGASLTSPVATNANLLNRMQDLRLGSAGRSQTGPGQPFNMAGLGGILGGVGALGVGAGVLGGGLGLFGSGAGIAGMSDAAVAAGFAGTFSTLRAKREIEPLDVDEYERARLKVKDTPVVRFKYKWDRPEDRKHLGIIIETSPEDVSRDGVTLDMPGYMGLTLAAVKGVDRRVDRLEARLPVGKRARLQVDGRVIEKRRLPVRSAA